MTASSTINPSISPIESNHPEPDRQARPASRIEILSTDLLDQHRPLVEELRQLAGKLSLDFGWHYLLDLTWIIHNLGPVSGKTVIDAGAGTGVLQWYLAEHGAQVISIDRLSRVNLALQFRGFYRVSGLRPQDLTPPGEILRTCLRRGELRLLSRSLLAYLRGYQGKKQRGAVSIYNQNLKAMPEIPDSSVDAVVSVSSLEHNQPEGLQEVARELERVLKAGGILLATLGAAKESDWFHEPSQGWCYTAESLRRLFDLPENTPDNYDQHDQLLEQITACAELRDHLAHFYFKSGNNGMPWGKWHPQYQPVGVLKVKPGSQTTVQEDAHEA